MRPLLTLFRLLILAASASASDQAATYEIDEKSWSRFKEFLTETIKQNPDPN